MAAIFYHLEFFTGLSGINAGGMPGDENKWTFTVVGIDLITIAGGLVVWFKKILDKPSDTRRQSMMHRIFTRIFIFLLLGLMAGGTCSLSPVFAQEKQFSLIVKI